MSLGGYFAPRAAAFERDTGHRVRLSSGASGRLYAQIVNGAPYEHAAHVPFALKDGTPAPGARALPDPEIVAGTKRIFEGYGGAGFSGCDVGLVFDLTDDLSVFGNFSQGISVPGTDNLYNAFFFPFNTDRARPAPDRGNDGGGGLQLVTRRTLDRLRPSIR